MTETSQAVSDQPADEIPATESAILALDGGGVATGGTAVSPVKTPAPRGGKSGKGVLPGMILLALFLGSYVGFIAGEKAVLPPKVVFAEKSALILMSVLSNQSMTQADMDERITKPIRAVIQKYVDRGYIVIDSGKDENGNMIVTGLPAGAVDITPELKAALAAANVKAGAR